MARTLAEGVEGLGCLLAFDAVRDVLRQRGTMLEAVPRAAAEQPPPGALRMGRKEKVRVARQLVLADARTDDRRLAESREPPPRVVASGLCQRLEREPFEPVG